MTTRDRIIVVVVLVAALLGGVWFVGIAPKRQDAAKLQTQIDSASQELANAKQQAAQARQAKARYDADYAEVARLGKAVPKDDALPSLLYQLQTAARGARIDFGSVKVAGNQAQAATPSAAATKAAGTTSSSTTAPTQSATAGLPPGATVGSAGFPTMPFSFVFTGSYADMEHFLHDVQHFVSVDGERVSVRGRLLSIDGFALTAGPKGFPGVKASISATAYLQSPSDAGSTSTTPPATGSASGTSTPTAMSVATGVAR